MYSALSSCSRGTVHCTCTLLLPDEKSYPWWKRKNNEISVESGNPGADRRSACTWNAIHIPIFSRFGIRNVILIPKLTFQLVENTNCQRGMSEVFTYPSPCAIFNMVWNTYSFKLFWKESTVWHYQNLKDGYILAWNICFWVFVWKLLLLIRSWLVIAIWPE
jgi:hypothetical protein